MDPWTSLFGNDLQKAAAMNAAASSPPRMLDLLPPVDPASEQSRISRAMEDSLGGLAYVGKVLNKPGRAIRGLLGGTPEEALAAIPFSDALGLSDEANQVTGRDLLYNAGLIDSSRNDGEFDANDLAGIGVEFATDPLSFLSFGGLTAAGRAAQAAGTSAQGLRAGLAAGERGLLGIGLPFKNPAYHIGTTPQALDNLQTAGSWLRSGVTLPTRAVDYGISAATGYKPLAGTQNVLSNVASSIYDPLASTARGLFQGKYLGMTGRAQGIAPETAEFANQLKRESLGVAQGLDQRVHMMETGIDPLLAANSLPGAGRVAPAATPDELSLMLRAAGDLTEGLPEVGGTIGMKLPAGIRSANNVPEAYDTVDQMLKLGVLTPAQEQRAIKHVMDYEALLTARRPMKAQQKLNEFNDVLVPKLVGKKMFDYGGTLSNPLPAVNSINDIGPVGDLIRNNPLLSRAERKAAGEIQNDLFMASMGGTPKFPDHIAAMTDLTQKVFRREVGQGAKPIQSQNLQQARKILTPEQFQMVEDLGGFTEKMYGDILKVEGQTAAKGAGKEVASDFISYAFRQTQKTPRMPNETLNSYNERIFGMYQADHKALSRRSEIFDVPGGTDQLRAWGKNPLVSGPARTLSDKEAVRFFREELSGTKALDPKSPIARQAKRLAKFYKGIDPEYAEKGVDLFSTDLSGLAISRLAKKDKLLTVEDIVERSLKYMDHNGNIIADGHAATPVTDYMKAMNLAFERDGVATPFAQRLMQSTGKSLKEIKEMHIPTDIANDVMGIGKVWDVPAALQPVMKGIDFMANLFRGLSTRPFLSYVVRNLANDMFSQARGGALTAAEMKAGFPSLSLASNFHRGSKMDIIPGKLSAAQLERELVQMGEFRLNQASTSDIIGAGGEPTYRGFQRTPDEVSGNSMVGDAFKKVKDLFDQVRTKPKEVLNPANMAGANTDTDRFILAQANNALGELGNKITRTSHYISLRKQGFTPEAAAESMKKFQLDYSNLTSFERNVMRRLVPWYNFSRQMLPTLVEDLIKQPAYMAGPIRALTGGRPQGDFVPGYIAEGASVPIGGAPEGQQRYISSFGLPMEDESIKALAALASGDVRRAGETALGMTMPWIKFPFEYTFDKQLYSGRALSELKPYSFADLGGLLSEPQARVLTSLIAQSPASRGFNTADRILDDRKDPLTKILNLATGIRMTDVDYDKARDANTQRLLENILEGQTGVRKQSGVYIPMDRVLQGDIPQSEGELYRMYLNTEQRMRDAARKRKLNSELPSG
jgi:hypothetical protein